MRPFSFIALGAFFSLFSGTAFGEGPIERVFFFTDIEGDYAKLDQFIRTSGAFYPEPGTDVWHQKPGVLVIDGGDAGDNHPYSRKVVRELSRFADEAKDRFIIIGGNRDPNKVRIPLELGEKAMSRHPANAKDGTIYADWLVSQKLSDSKPTRLKWILSKTMGAPKAFEYRRGELAEERSVALSAISDDQIVESYLEEVGPDGTYTRFLKQGRLIYSFDNNLIIHADMSQENFLQVPGMRGKCRSVATWERKLNAWYQRRLNRYSQALRRGTLSESDIADLVNYSWATEGKLDNRWSVMYSRTHDKDRMSQLPPEKVRARLMDEGYNRLLKGDWASGQLPLVMRDGDFELICADNSWGTPGECSVVELARVGKTWDTVRITGMDPASKKRIQYGYSTGESSPMGHWLADGSVVVGKNNDGWISFRMDTKFNVFYRQMAPGEAFGTNCMQLTGGAH